MIDDVIGIWCVKSPIMTSAEVPVKKSIGLLNKELILLVIMARDLVVFLLFDIKCNH